jgi:hypothetical protein
MDGIGIGNLYRSHDARNAKIGLGRGRRPDTYGFVGEAHMKAFAVGSRIDCHCFDAHFSASTDNPQGDFATIRYEYFIEHK